jgi:hypothetical protein
MTVTGRQMAFGGLDIFFNQIEIVQQPITGRLTFFTGSGRLVQ